MKKQEKTRGRAISMRLNILFFCVFLLFPAMIIQLGKVQIIDGETLRALQVSSNVYMFHTALKIAGVDYVKNSSLNIKQEYFDKMRYYFR